MINAAQFSLPGAKGQLCQTFNSASVSDTAAIGHAFASALKGFEAGQTLRVGLRGGLRDGKSVFIQGILDAFADKDCIETKISEEDAFGSPQSLWRTHDGMWLRHCDAGFTTMEGSLSSYWKNNLDTQGSPFADIVEHPALDKNNKLFDCIIKIKQTDTEQRSIEIMATEALAQSPGFQKFLNNAAPFLAP